MNRVYAAIAGALLAATGHAGASVLAAVLLFTARVIRTVLPVFPQIVIGAEATVIAVLAVLLWRSLWPHPRLRTVTG